MIRLLIATSNPGKLREIRALLDISGLVLIDPSMIGIRPQVEETGAQYADNAHLKASISARTSGIWTLADDSGLEVDVLGGAPGLQSARLGGPGSSDGLRRRLLLKKLHPHPQPWTARFRCVVALANPEGEVDLAEGTCLGEIIATERGSAGFGYDPIFLVQGTDYTMAELSLEEKNRLSHRAKAIKELLPTLKKRLGLEERDLGSEIGD
jgi:XTP/dITP diphosphohydrolase